MVIVGGPRLSPWAGVQLGTSATDDRDSATFSSTTAAVGLAWELEAWGQLRRSAADERLRALTGAWA